MGLRKSHAPFKNFAPLCFRKRLETNLRTDSHNAFRALFRSCFVFSCFCKHEKFRAKNEMKIKTIVENGPSEQILKSLKVPQSSSNSLDGLKEAYRLSTALHMGDMVPYMGKTIRNHL